MRSNPAQSKPCARCHEADRQPGQSYCRPCASEYQRLWQQKQVLTPEQLQKKNARRAAADRKSRGKLVPPERCERCGEPGDLQMHHEDYSKPLEVVWLHLACHRALHRERGDVMA